MSHDPAAGEKLYKGLVSAASTSCQAELEPDLEESIAVVQCFVRDPDARKQLFDTLTDALFRQLLASARRIVKDMPESSQQPECEKLLARFSALTDSRQRSRLARLMVNAARTAETDSSTSSSRRDRLRKKLGALCFLCGEPIEADASEAKQSVVDHIWPASAGGGTGKKNLGHAHAACEAAKFDLAVPSDAPTGRLSFAKPPSAFEKPASNLWPRSIDSRSEATKYYDEFRALTLRTAIVRKQSFRCYSCGGDFSKAGPFNLSRREDQLPWTYTNTIALCKGCERP